MTLLMALLKGGVRPRQTLISFFAFRSMTMLDIKSVGSVTLQMIYYYSMLSNSAFNRPCALRGSCITGLMLSSRYMEHLLPIGLSQ